MLSSRSHFRAFAFATLALAFPSTGSAEEEPPAGATKSGPSVGFVIHRMQDDFGLGARIASPVFWKWLRVTGSGGIAWYPHAVASDGSTTWDAMYYGGAGLEVVPPFLSTAVGAVRPYAFSGAIALFPPRSLSTERVALGGLGGFGLEARFLDGRGREGPLTYFFEIGGIGTGAKANELTSREYLASGLLIQAGFRVYP